MTQDQRSTAKTICLCMIVRNESAVIRRALASVRGLIDYWIVCDTGSTDGTPAIVLEELCGIPGEIHSRPWVNFGHNRAEALALARPHADYSLILDADMIANVRGDVKSQLHADSYEIRYEGALDYSQPMLVSNAHEWRYVGVTHEYLTSDTAASWAFLPELTLIHFGDGGMRSDKFERDLRLLTAAHEHDPGDSRTIFYLAQTCHDLGDLESALQWYRRRAECERGWDEEKFYSLLRIARIEQRLGGDPACVAEAFLDAFAARPSRLEPLYDLARTYRLWGDDARARLYSSAAAADLPYPPDRLFVERPVYEYKLALEYALSSLGLGRISDSMEAFRRVLDAPGCSQWAGEAAIRGIDAALEHVGHTHAVAPGPHNRIKVVVPFHNPGHFLDNCIESLLAQDYERFEIVFVDDASDDGSQRRVPRDDARVTYVRSNRRRGPAASTHLAVTEHCDADDIVVHVDGDDWLAVPDALRFIDEAYERHRCWVLYGQHVSTSGSYGICRPFASATDFERRRESWVASHVKTYRAGLYHRIADQDPDYSSMKNDAGEWLTSASDAALMFALTDLAGFHRVRFNSRLLYVYNTDNPNNIHHHRRREQTDNFSLVCRKRRLQAIASYAPAAAAVEEVA